MIILPEVTFTPIATIGFGQGSTEIPTLYYLDDNSVFSVASANNRGYAQFYAVDKSGAVTYWLYYTPSYVRTIIPLGAGFFFIGFGNGDSFIQQFYNAKLNNGNPLVIRKGAPLSNPCYNLNPQFFYDRIRNILAAGFYDPSGQYGGPVYASFFAPTTRGLLPLQSGFVGYYNSATGYDPFNQTAKAAPPNSTPQNFGGNQSNAITQSLYSYNGRYIISVANYAVNMGLATNCATPSGAVVSLQSAYNNIANAGAPGAGYASAFDSNIAGLTACNVDTSQYALQIFYNSTSVYLLPHNAGGGACFVLTKTGNLFASNIVSSASQSIMIAQFNAATSFNNYSRTASLLINSHRPVSIFGSYKA